MQEILNLNYKDHVVAIGKYIEVIVQADDMHALIVEGPPGWGKTTAVENALKISGFRGVHVGSYSTPLNLFNFLAENNNRIIIADDCAGIFNDSSAMAILKAATWPLEGNRRIVKWGSTSSRATTNEFEFYGKLIIVCNYFPNSPDAEAIRSRGYVRKVDINLVDAKRLLKHAAQDPKWFQNNEIAIQVADFLIARLQENNLFRINFRTLKKGYRLAEVHKDSWQELFADTLPIVKKTPEELVLDLSKQNIKVKDQARVFREQTGLKTRSFYNYRKEANLSVSIKNDFNKH
mgnify:CR=1 FL=1